MTSMQGTLLLQERMRVNMTLVAPLSTRCSQHTGDNLVAASGNADTRQHNVNFTDGVGARKAEINSGWWNPQYDFWESTLSSVSSTTNATIAKDSKYKAIIWIIKVNEEPLMKYWIIQAVKTTWLICKTSPRFFRASRREEKCLYRRIQSRADEFFFIFFSSCRYSV